LNSGDTEVCLLFRDALSALFLLTAWLIVVDCCADPHLRSGAVSRSPLLLGGSAEEDHPAGQQYHFVAEL
jgi:hypothetical protein